MPFAQHGALSAVCFAAHLAVSAAQPVAAHGIVGKRALLAAVGSILCAFL